LITVMELCFTDFMAREIATGWAGAEIEWQ